SQAPPATVVAFADRRPDTPYESPEEGSQVLPSRLGACALPETALPAAVRSRRRGLHARRRKAAGVAYGRPSPLGCFSAPAVHSVPVSSRRSRRQARGGHDLPGDDGRATGEGLATPPGNRPGTVQARHAVRSCGASNTLLGIRS